MSEINVITCVECGDKAHLLIVPDTDPEPGMVLTYRCESCLARWDVVYEDPLDD